MKTVLLLCGGRSGEHEISLISAKCILDAMDRSRFAPVVVGISKQGVWYLEEEESFYQGEFRADKISLNENADRVTLAPYLQPNGRARLEAQGRIIEFDIVFPILHGPFGEDGTLQGMLDMIGVPYVGSNCGSSWNCMDKVMTKAICQDAAIPSAPYLWVSSLEEAKSREDEIKKLGFPLFVKPSRMGSSVGVSKVTEEKALQKAILDALAFDRKVLIEKGITGREIECAVLGLNRDAKASVPGEIVVSKKIGWYSYEAKYLLKDGAETLTPAPLDPKTTKAVQDLAVKVFQVMECDGLARVDLFLESGTNQLYLNEVNTLPGFTPISMYPQMWQATGINYQNLISKLLDLAMERVNPH